MSHLAVCLQNTNLCVTFNNNIRGTIQKLQNRVGTMNDKQCDRRPRCPHSHQPAAHLHLTFKFVIRFTEQLHTSFIDIISSVLTDRQTDGSLIN